MKFLDWVFGRTPKINDSGESLPPFRWEVEQPKPRPPEPVIAVTATLKPSPETRQGDVISRQTPSEPGEFRIIYQTPGHLPRERRVIFLFGSPGNIISAIDVEKRRLRHYRLDRISQVSDRGTNKVFESGDFFVTTRQVHIPDLKETDPNRDMALLLRKSMACQLSLAILIARAAGNMDGRALDAIMDYARGYSRAAVRDGWVPAGPKGDAWPILRDMVLQLQPQRRHVDVYVRTLTDDWDIANRFETLSALLSRLANRNAPVNAAVVAIAEDIARARTA